jgi:hypothetical protein
MGRWTFALFLPWLLSCSVGSGLAGDAVHLSAKLLLPTGSAQAGGAVKVNPITVTGQAMDSVCDTDLDADSSFSCDVPTGLSGASLLLVTYSLPSAPGIVFVALTSPTIPADPVVFGSLDDLIGQRAIFLMSLGVSAQSALRAAQNGVSAAMGGLPVADSRVVTVFEQAVAQLAAVRGISTYAVLTDLLQQDFSPDGVFDGNGANGPASASGYTVRAQDWLDLGDLQVQPLLAAAADDSGLIYAAFVGSPPLPVMVPYVVIEPLSVASDPANVIVSWTNALADSYSLVISSSADCANPVQNYSGLTNTSQVLAPLGSDSVYYVCLTAFGDGGVTLAPQMSNLGAISFRTGP